MALLCAGPGCGVDGPERPAAATLGAGVAPGGWRVEGDPVDAQGRLAPVGRLTLSALADAASTAPPPGDLVLFEGALSDAEVTRVSSRRLTQALLSRRVESTAWSPGSGRVELAPSSALDPGARYTLAVQGLGALATFEVASGQGLRTFARWWPSVEEAAGAEALVYCGSGGRVLEERSVELDPGGLPATLRPGVGPARLDAERCVEVRPALAPEPGAVVVPPARVDDVLLEPSPVVVESADALVAAGVLPTGGCASPSLELGPSCVSILDDRLVLAPIGAGAAWLLSGPFGSSRQRVDAGRSLVVRGLAPGAEQAVSGEWRDLWGRSHPVQLEFRTQPALPHLVLSEVMANPRGPEPAQEWVELVNDGISAVELQGWVFDDGAGRSVLPAASLEAGRYALLVARGYDPSAPLDFAPAPGTLIVTVESLGKAGLSNAGEVLRLWRPEGELGSTFASPLRPAEGRSLARRQPSTPDSDGDAFGLHGGSGASPGEPNSVGDLDGR